MERTSAYITVAEAVRVFRISSEDVLRFCREKKIGYALQKEGAEISPSASDLAFVLKRALPDDVSYASVDDTYQFILREKRDKVVTYTNGAMHHDDGYLLPPLEKTRIHAQEEHLLLDDATIEPLLDDGKADILLETPVNEVSTPGENVSSVESAVLVKPVQKEQAPSPTVSQPEATPLLVEQKEAEKIPVYNVKPVFIPKETSFPPQTERKLTPQNPRPIVAEKKIPVPHVPIFAPIGSLHPLAQPPLVIPFATPAPAAHVKVAAVFTQPHARAAEWMPWMRTSQWLKRAVSKATKHPEIIQARSGLPVTSSGVSTVSAQSTATETPPPAPLSPVVSSQSPLVDEKQASVVRMQHPEVKDALDHALFGEYIPQKATQSNTMISGAQSTSSPTGENAKRVDEKPQIQDSFDALLFS